MAINKTYQSVKHLTYHRYKLQEMVNIVFYSCYFMWGDAMKHLAVPVASNIANSKAVDIARYLESFCTEQALMLWGEGNRKPVGFLSNADTVSADIVADINSDMINITHNERAKG